MDLPTITDWKSLSARAKSEGKPVVIMVDQAHCPYCRRVEGEFFASIFAEGVLPKVALFGKISIDEGEQITDETGNRIGTRDFLGSYDTGLTPTVLFLDYNKTEVAEKIVGMLTPDFYGFYLEQAIRSAIDAVKLS